MKNISIREKGIKNNPKRYRLVYEDVFCKEIIKPDVEDINEYGNMTLNTIDSFTSKYWDKSQLLHDLGIEEDKTPHKVYIEYKSNGEIKNIPVMYNDALLGEIASKSSAKLWDDRKTRQLFTNMSIVWLRNDYSELEKLLNSEFVVTEPHLRNVIGYGLNHGTHTMNIPFMKEKIFDSYKQWRAFYYHTMYTPEQKVKKKV